MAETESQPDPAGGMGGKLSRRAGIFRQLMVYLWQQKLWWLIPLILVLGTVALLAGGAAMSGVAPFIYVLF